MIPISTVCACVLYVCICLCLNIYLCNADMTLTPTIPQNQHLRHLPHYTTNTPVRHSPTLMRTYSYTHMHVCISSYS